MPARRSSCISMRLSVPVPATSKAPVSCTREQGGRAGRKRAARSSVRDQEIPTVMPGRITSLIAVSTAAPNCSERRSSSSSSSTTMRALVDAEGVCELLLPCRPWQSRVVHLDGHDAGCARLLEQPRDLEATDAEGLADVDLGHVLEVVGLGQLGEQGPMLEVDVVRCVFRSLVLLSLR